MTYKFEQFNVEVVDPTIEVNAESILVKPVLMQIGVDVTLTTPNGSKFGVWLDEVPVVNLEFQGYQNLYDTVKTYLDNNYTV